MAYLKDNKKDGTKERTAFLSKKELEKTIGQCLNVFSKIQWIGIPTFVFVDTDFKVPPGLWYTPGLDVVDGDYYRIQIQKTNIGFDVSGWINGTISYQLRNYEFSVSTKLSEIVEAMACCSLDLLSENDSCFGRSQKTYYQSI